MNTSHPALGCPGKGGGGMTPGSLFERCRCAPGLLSMSETQERGVLCVSAEVGSLFRSSGGLLLGLGILRTFGGYWNIVLWAIEVLLSSLASLLNFYFPILFYFLSFFTNTWEGFHYMISVLSGSW